MHRLFFLFVFLLHGLILLSQRTAFPADPRGAWEQAVQWFYEGKESLAYPVFLHYQTRPADPSTASVDPSERAFYRLACGVRLDEPQAVEEAASYLQQVHPPAFIHSLAYYVGEHHFRRQQYGQAQNRLDLIDPRNLRAEERIHRQFMLGYTHFLAQRFGPAQSYFDSVRTQVKHPDHDAANYYFGFLCLRNQQYQAALKALRGVEDHPDYRSVVPYYIGQLYYLQGEKSEAIEYVERKLKDPASQYYELPLKQLLGHAYFERRSFDKALPLLKEYVARAEKVRREDMYELSYCYHQSAQYEACLPGFRELAGGQDSISQHAMYLLGDAYLKTGDLNSARNAFQFCARNNSYPIQREISLLQYAKLSYELSFLNESQLSLEQFLKDHPQSTYREEAQELMVIVLSATNNFRQALQWVERIERPTPALKKWFPRIWYGRAMELINDQLFDRAQSLLDLVMQDANAGQWKQQARFWSGEIAYRRNDPGAAVMYLTTFLSDPSTPAGEVNVVNARYTLGYAHLRSATYAAAGEQFLTITKSMSGQPSSLLQDAWLRAGDCFYMRREYNKAKPHYERAVTMMWPAADYAQYQLAMIAGIRSLPEKIRLLQLIPEKYPRSALLPDTYLEMANAYIADRKFQEAIPVLDKVIQFASQDNWISRALLMQGICLYNLEKYEESLQRLKEGVRRFPDSEDAGDAIENIRQVYLEMGKPYAFVTYMQAIGKPLEYPIADSLTYAAADLMYTNGQANEALEALRKYLADHPNGRYRLKAFDQSADLLIRRREWTEALSALDSVLARRPNKFEESAWRRSAQLAYFELKDPARALPYYRGLSAVTRNQEWRLEALRGSVRCHHQLKEWSAGEPVARTLLTQPEATPDDKALSYMILAQQALTAKKWVESMEAFRALIPFNKGSLSAEARYQIARIYFEQGKWIEAEKAAEEMIRRSGSFEPWATRAYILLGDVYVQQKDFFNAKATYQSVIDNAEDPLLQAEAKEKLQQVVELERKSTKLDS